MEFNFSQKTDPETGNVKISIDGDKEFIDSFTIIKKVLSKSVVDVASQLIKQINIEHKQFVKDAKVLDIVNSRTINADDTLADLITKQNPELIDRIVLLKEEDGKTIGLTIK